MVSSSRVRKRDEHGAFILGTNDSLDDAETSRICEHAAQGAMVETGFVRAPANVGASIWRHAGFATAGHVVVFIYRDQQRQSGQRSMDCASSVAHICIYGGNRDQCCVVAVSINHGRQKRSEGFFGSVVKTYCGMRWGRSL